MRMDERLSKKILMPAIYPQYLCDRRIGHTPGVDYRKLNKITTNDPYPLPNIEELIANIGPSKCISTLDLTKGHYQVPVNPKHCEKIAFVSL